MSTDIVPKFNAFAAKENISIFLFLRFQARPIYISLFHCLMNQAFRNSIFYTVFSEFVKNSFIILVVSDQCECVANSTNMIFIEYP